MNSYVNVVIILQFSITDLKDLRKYRNTSKLFRSMIDNNCYDIWRRLMTQENFNKAASQNYLPFFYKWLELMDEFDINLFQPFYHSTRNKYFEFSNNLLSFINKPLALLISARYGDCEKVEILLNAGIDVNTVFSSLKIESRTNVSFSEVMSLWGYEYEEGHESYRSFFWSKKEFKEIFFDCGSSVLNLACLSGDLKTVQKVLEYNPNKREYSYRSIVEYALSGGNKEIVRLVYSLIDFDGLERELDLSEEMEEYSKRLLGNCTEISDFDVEDFKMFAELSKNISASRFIEKVFDFGNVVYYQMAKVVFDKNLGDGNFKRQIIRYLDDFLHRDDFDKETQRYSYCQSFRDILNK